MNARDSIPVADLKVGQQITVVVRPMWSRGRVSIVTETITKLTKTRVVTNRSRWIIRDGVLTGRREGVRDYAELYRPWDMRLVAIRGEAETYRLLQNARQTAEQFSKSPTKVQAIALREQLQAWLERDPE